MIESAQAIKIYNEALGAKGAKARMVRVAPEGFYEVKLEVGGKYHTTLLPIQATVILNAEADEEIPSVEVER